MNICLLPFLFLHLSSQIIKGLLNKVRQVPQKPYPGRIRKKMVTFCGYPIVAAAVCVHVQGCSTGIAPLDVTVGAEDESSTVTGSSSVDHLTLVLAH